METWDAEIRFALHKKKLRHQHSCPNTYVIDELGVAHGKQRIDIAVINGSFHGYEIKSSKDNLNRFPEQLDAFMQCFEKLSIVTAPNHLDGVINLSPEWSEIIVAEKGARGGIRFSSARRGKKNPEVNLVSILQFLWRREALDFLYYLGKTENIKYGTRIELYNQISEMATIEDILNWIKMSFRIRKNWRLDE